MINKTSLLRALVVLAALIPPTRMTAQQSDADWMVETPASLDADVSLDTMHGSISSDWPVQLSGRFGPRHAEGTIGRGGRSIKLRTLNGSVEIGKTR